MNLKRKLVNRSLTPISAPSQQYIYIKDLSETQIQNTMLLSLLVNHKFKLGSPGEKGKSYGIYIPINEIQNLTRLLARLRR